MSGFNRRAGVVRLIRGGRVLTRGSRGLHLLRCPGGLVPINGRAAAILTLCDGSRSRREIIDQLCGAEPDAAQLVSEFLDAARKSEWITEGDSKQRRSAAH
jgi:hypothetical protein